MIILSEIVGRTSVYNRPLPARVSVDRTQTDYAWWSRFRRGKQPGYELGGLFAKPIIEIIAGWVLGSGFAVDTGVEATDEGANEFISERMAQLLQTYRDMLALGDCYVVVNADGSLSVVPPDLVEVVTDPYDYRRVLAYKITSRLETVTVIDEYQMTMRFLTFKHMRDGRPLEEKIEFINPLGMIPVVHFAYGREANETHGHPVYEALLHLFTRYDDLVNKSLDGAEVMGRPVPVAIVPNPQQAREENSAGDETVTNSVGVETTRDVTDFDGLDMLWLQAGQGTDFKFVAPGRFSEDSVALLKKLFYLLLEHIGIPEWAWGGAIASSKASVDAQMPAFLRLIDSWRLMVEEPLIELLNIWMATASYTSAVRRPERVRLVWPEVTSKDEGLLLNKVRYAHQEAGLLTDAKALTLLELVNAEEVQAEVEAAKEEAQTAADEFNQLVDQKMDAMNDGQDGQEDEDDG